MSQPYTLLMIIAGSFLFVLLVAARQWYLEYRIPTWRKYQWRDLNHRIIHYRPMWQPWFAWRPVRTINEKVVWWETVYRTIGNDYVDHDDWRWYHYGDILDVLTNS